LKHWTDDDVNWLVNNYPSLGKMASASYLNKSEASIRQKASKLNLRIDKDNTFFKEWQLRAAKSKVGKKRPEQAKVMLELHKQGRLRMTDNGKKLISEKTKERLLTTEHPKGFSGKSHSPDTKKKISISSRTMWADSESIVNQSEYRQTISDRMSLQQREGKLRNGYSRGSQGRRADLGNIFFRSSWEANYARYLNFLMTQGQIYKWEFEPDTFWFEEIKRGVRSYLPDFKLWDSKDSDPYYVEVKGWMDDKSKTKIKRMKKYYPHIRLDVFDSKQYAEIKKKLSRLIKGWE